MIHTGIGMTNPSGGATSPKPFTLPKEAGVIALNIPGEVYAIRAEEGTRETLVTGYDLSQARMGGNDVRPTWSSPEIALSTYGLGLLRTTCERLLGQVFGPSAVLNVLVESDIDAQTPILVFECHVPRDKREMKHDFVDRYVRETEIPEGSPVPVLTWAYSAVSA